MLASRPIARLLPPGGANQAAMLPLHRQVLGERGLETQVVGIASIDSAHQGLHQPLQGLPSQPASDKRRQALLGVLISPGNNQIHQHPQLAAPGQHGSRQYRQDAVRGHEHKAFRDRC